MGSKVRSDVRNVEIKLSYKEAKMFTQIFQSLDKDKDGHISIYDLKKAIKDMGETITDRELRDLIAEVDINKNATIEEEEFLQVIYTQLLQWWLILVEWHASSALCIMS